MALATVLWGCYLTMMAMNWVLAARGAGAKVSLHAGVKIWLTSMPARYIPGNVWHVAGRFYLGAQAGLPAEATFVSSVVEQVLTVASELLVFVLLLPFWPGLPAIGFLGPIIAILLGLLALQPRVLAMALHLAGRMLRRPPTASALRYHQLLLLLLGYMTAALMNGVAFAVVAAQLGGVDWTQFPLLAGSYLLARAIGFLSLVTPAGLGVREALLAGLLAPHLSLPLATAVSLLARFLATAAEGLAALGINIVAVARRDPDFPSAEVQP